MQTLTNQSTLLRIGAVSAVLGAVVQVGAGIGGSVAFGTTPTGAAAEVLLPVVANQPWAWTTLQLGFVLGPVLWVVAFVALAATLTQGWHGTLALLAAATIVVGAAVHIVSSSVNGFALPALASAWASATASEQANLALIGNALLYLIDGTWASAITLFHGLPFVLSGLAVVASGRYPALVGWVGFLGGSVSVWLSAMVLARRSPYIPPTSGCYISPASDRCTFPASVACTPFVIQTFFQSDMLTTNPTPDRSVPGPAGAKEADTGITKGNRSRRRVIFHWEVNMKANKTFIQAIVFSTVLAMWGSFVWLFWTLV